MERQVFLSAGHSNVQGRDRGASGNGFIEGEETAKVRSLIYDKLKAKGCKVFRDPNNTILADTLKNFKNLVKPEDILLDIHFNAGPQTACGVETFVSVNPAYAEVKLAQALSYAVSSTLGIPLRGNKGVKLETESQHAGGLGWMRLNGQNVLLEVCFISNPIEMQKYSSRKEQLSQAVADVLFSFSKEENNFPQTFTPAKSYTVQSGDSLSHIASIYGTTVEALAAKNGITNLNEIHIGQKLLIP